MVLKSDLSSTNKLETINTLAVTMVTYSFNIINWTLQELAKLDTKTRKFLTLYKMHHPKSDVDRLHLPRTEGDRGLIQLKLSYKSTIISLDEYLQETQDTLLHFVKDHDDRKSLNFISRQSMKFSRELGVPAIPAAEDEPTPPMPAEQRPRPNTRVASCSGPSGSQKRSTANTHNG